MYFDGASINRPKLHPPAFERIKGIPIDEFGDLPRTLTMGMSVSTK